MNRNLLYGAVLVLAVSLLVGSGGFSAVSADRGVGAAVAADERAYLGIQDRTPAEGTVAGEPITLLEVTDNFPADVDLDSVRLTDAQAPIALRSGSLELDPSGDVTATCTAPTDGTETVSIRLRASGAGVEMALNRQIAVDCSPAALDPADITFYGCGKAHVGAPDATLDSGLDVTLVGVNGGGVTETADTVTAADRSTAGPKGKSIGLAVPSEGLVVTNPNYDFDADDCSGAAAGTPAEGIPGDPRDTLDGATSSEE
ncbi:hypothetical protein GJ629_10440 [Halapricum sp. CBA1109]|uniref:hypothetical protein n=1 Tax=Halapricum sp. CBA1109 TaxID=2668068 RepID=UPI0012F7C1F8|nr:hypothetical protein [Halapricum sp. CBA1109]MUV90259.1 hypothetical protein [Halapricum sp. CBA1109]